jgi:hypothetical protein
MSRINLPVGDMPDTARLFSMNPAMGKALAGLSQAIYSQTTIDLRVPISTSARCVSVSVFRSRQPSLQPRASTKLFTQPFRIGATARCSASAKKLLSTTQKNLRRIISRWMRIFLQICTNISVTKKYLH